MSSPRKSGSTKGWQPHLSRLFLEDDDDDDDDDGIDGDELIADSKTV